MLIIVVLYISLNAWNTLFSYIIVRHSLFCEPTHAALNPGGDLFVSFADNPVFFSSKPAAGDQTLWFESAAGDVSCVFVSSETLEAVWSPLQTMTFRRTLRLRGRKECPIKPYSHDDCLAWITLWFFSLCLSCVLVGESHVYSPNACCCFMALHAAGWARGRLYGRNKGGEAPRRCRLRQNKEAEMSLWGFKVSAHTWQQGNTWTVD